jgi:hypothetical protein
VLRMHARTRRTPSSAALVACGDTLGQKLGHEPSTWGINLPIVLAALNCTLATCTQNHRYDVSIRQSLLWFVPAAAFPVNKRAHTGSCFAASSIIGSRRSTMT